MLAVGVGGGCEGHRFTNFHTSMGAGWRSADLMHLASNHAPLVQALEGHVH